MRLLILLACLAVGPSWATLEVLDESGTQSALVLQVLPKPVRLRVTDNGVPVKNASVNLRSGWLGYPNTGLNASPECVQFDMDSNCLGVTNDEGVVEYLALTSDAAGQISVGATARVLIGETWKHLGDASLTFSFHEGDTSGIPRVSIIGENEQRVPAGTRAQRVQARLTNRAGQPLAGLKVEFKVKRTGEGDARFEGHPVATTDANGLATSPPVFAGSQDRTNLIYVRAVGEGDTTLAVAGPNSNERYDPPRLRSYQQYAPEYATTLWWGGPSENGWGMSTFVQDYNELFNVLFVYDETGAPTWFVLPAGSWSPTEFGRYAGPVYSPRSTPWFAYDAAGMRAGPSVGNLDIILDDPTATIRFLLTAGGKATAKQVVRQDFSGGGDWWAVPEGLWWGGGSQNGWGLAIHRQQGNLFMVWFTYDQAGKPVWFVMPASEEVRGEYPVMYRGPIYRTHGAAWHGTTYDAGALRLTSFGSYVLKVAGVDPERLVLEYELDGHTGQLNLEPQSFSRYN